MLVKIVLAFVARADCNASSHVLSTVAKMFYSRELQASSSRKSNLENTTFGKLAPRRAAQPLANTATLHSDVVHGFIGAGSQRRNRNVFGSGQPRMAAGQSQRNVHRISASESSPSTSETKQPMYGGIAHQGVLVSSTVRALNFYRDVLGMEDETHLRNPKLPFPGAFVRAGASQIHIMEVGNDGIPKNPDPTENRPAHGGLHLRVLNRQFPEPCS
eukprot:gnl/MRDRNA2_/MRDRNA2_81022_c0_seq3.p1 gnl/MRDRNA2_/MRDRNA2_81022_c0~~gnl/MRDRNA2_/MRDRNA2_81022_c0_seq3.p1  ORF type:complete len:216 (+),score=30.58 gnl/MRDRNA2_/MRDRNA2_81022_c0_seq3:110-757(+)